MFEHLRWGLRTSVRLVQITLFLWCLTGVLAAQGSDRALGNGEPEQPDPKEFFRKGILAYQKGRFEEAASWIQQCLATPTDWEEYAQFYLLRSLREGGRSQDALQRCQAFRTRFPASPLVDRVEVIEARALQETGAYGPAAKACLALLARRERADIRLLLGGAQEAQGNLQAALEDYLKIRRRWPTSREAREAKGRMSDILRKQPSLKKDRNPSSLLEEAMLCLEEKEYPEAIALYQELLGFPVVDPAMERTARWGEIRALLKTGRLEAAQGVLGTLMERHPASPEVPQGMLAVGRSYWNRGQNTGALSLLRPLLEQHTDTAEAMDAAYIMGRILFEQEDFRGAVLQFRRTRFLFPNTPMEGEAAWWEGWSHYLLGDYLACAQQLRESIDGCLWEDGTEKSRALYWEARSLGKAGKREASDALYGEILRNHPSSFYALLAEKRLQGGPLVLGVSSVKDEGTLDGSVLQPANSCRIPDPILPVLLEVGLPRDAAQRLDWLRGRPETKDLPLDLWIETYSWAGAYGAALRIAREVRFLDRLLERYLSGDPSQEIRISLQSLYPLAYWDLIRERSGENGLDPFLVLGLIHQESLFVPDVASPAGAIGLMQIMPSTGSLVSREIGLREFRTSRLEDPEANIRIGTAYLAGLDREYQESWPRVLAAYNAGPEAVTKWIASRPNAEEDEFIEGITYKETRIYVRKVLHNWFCYRKLYRTPVPEKVARRLGGTSPEGSLR